MTFTQSIKTCFRKYITFSGRATRSEFWWFNLFLILASIALAIVDGVIFGPTVTQTANSVSTTFGDGPISSVFSLATLVPLLAVTWRRMHDTNRPGYLVLVSWLFPFAALMLGAFLGMQSLLFLAFFLFVVVIGLNIYWLTRPSDPGANDYGGGGEVAEVFE